MITPTFGLTATERVLPRLALDFTTASLDPRITFTRAANTATRINSSGVLEVVNADTPRFDYNPVTLAIRGLLIEEARINSIRNNTMQGAAVGVIGSTGALPTNWFAWTGAGLTWEVAGLGAENGIDYIDIRVYGTSNSTAVFPAFEQDKQIAAVDGETWAQSVYFKIVAQPNPFNSYTQRIRINNSSGSQIAQIDSTFTPTTTLTRYTASGTIASATTAYVQPSFRFGLTNGGTYDVTFRIGLPQIEKGGSVTSVIKTSTAAVTRNGDLAALLGTDFSDWYNQTEGTFVVQWLCSPRTAANYFPKIFHVNDGVGSGNTGISVGMNAVSGNAFASVYDDANVFQGVSDSWANLAVGATAKTVLAYGSSIQAAQNAVLATEVTGIILPTAQTALHIGSSYSGLQLNSHIQKLWYYPQRLTNAEVQAFSK